MASYSKSIGSAGGSIDGDVAKLVVPENALTSTIEFELVTTAGGTVNSCTLTPSGTSFSTDATFSLKKPTAGSPGASYHIEVRDSESSEWEGIGGAEANGWIDVDIPDTVRFARTELDE